MIGQREVTKSISSKVHLSMQPLVKIKIFLCTDLQFVVCNKMQNAAILSTVSGNKRRGNETLSMEIAFLELSIHETTLVLLSLNSTNKTSFLFQNRVAIPTLSVGEGLVVSDFRRSENDSLFGLPFCFPFSYKIFSLWQYLF